MTEAWGSDPHVAVDIRPHENLRVLRPVVDKLIEFGVELLLLLRLIRGYTKQRNTLITSPFALLWYVSDERFDPFGKQRVIPIIRLGSMNAGRKVSGFSLPACAQARVISRFRMIMTTALHRGRKVCF